MKRSLPARWRKHKVVEDSTIEGQRFSRDKKIAEEGEWRNKGEVSDKS